MNAKRSPTNTSYFLATISLGFVAISLFVWIWAGRASSSILQMSLIAPQLLAYSGSLIYCVLWFRHATGFRTALGSAVFSALLAGLSTSLYCVLIAEGFRQINYFAWHQDWFLFPLFSVIESLVAALVGFGFSFAFLQTSKVIDRFRNRGLHNRA